MVYAHSRGALLRTSNTAENFSRKVFLLLNICEKFIMCTNLFPTLYLSSCTDRANWDWRRAFFLKSMTMFTIPITQPFPLKLTYRALTLKVTYLMRFFLRILKFPRKRYGYFCGLAVLIVFVGFQRWLLPEMREIVHIQAGQCGNQIGAKVTLSNCSVASTNGS